MRPGNQSLRFFCYLIVLQNRQRRCRKASLAISQYIIDNIGELVPPVAVFWYR